MIKKLIFPIFLSLICFLPNSKAAIMSLGSGNAIGNNPLGDKDEGNLKTLGSAKITSKASTSDSCIYTSANCFSPKIKSGAVNGFYDCFTSCECPSYYVEVDTTRATGVGTVCDNKYGSFVCNSSFTPTTNGCFCQDGTYYNSGTCTICPAGYYCANEEIATCAAGTYNPSTGQNSETACLLCNSGKTSGAGSSSCNITCSNILNVASWKEGELCQIEACNENAILSNNSCTSCTYSAPDGYQTTALSNCADESTYIAQIPSNDSCSESKDYFYSTSCTNCSTGYNSVNGTCQASECDCGKYLSNGYCYNCTSGYFCTGGSSFREVCPIGNYCPSQSCEATPCPSGTYRATTGATSSSYCLTCPSNSYSYSGSSDCTCYSGYTMSNNVCCKSGCTCVTTATALSSALSSGASCVILASTISTTSKFTVKSGTTLSAASSDISLTFNPTTASSAYLTLEDGATLSDIAINLTSTSGTAYAVSLGESATSYTAATPVLKNVIIKTTGTNGHGLYIPGYVNLSSSSNVNIKTSGTNAYGVYVKDSYSLVEKANLNIYTTGSGGHGFYLGSGAWIIDSELNIKTTNSSSGVYMVGTGQIRTSTFNILTTNSNSVGITFYGIPGWISSVTFKIASYGSPIYLNTSSGNVLVSSSTIYALDTASTRVPLQSSGATFQISSGNYIFAPVVWSSSTSSSYLYKVTSTCYPTFTNNYYLDVSKCSGLSNESSVTFSTLKTQIETIVNTAISSIL